MNAHLETPIPLTILNQAMREDFRSTVVKRALDHLDQVSDPTRRRFYAELRQHVRIAGFADPTRALRSLKRPALVSEVIRMSHLSSALMGAILRAWAESHAELQRAVSEFLRNAAEPPPETAPVETAFPAVWSAEEMQSATAEFLAKHPSFDEDDVALMLCYVSGRAPIPDEILEHPAQSDMATDEAEEPQEASFESQDPEAIQAATLSEASTVSETPTILQDIMARLQALPPDAEEWEHVSSLITSIQALAQDKLAAREQGRAELRQALTTLAREAEAALKWWGYDLTLWSAEICPWHQAAALAERVRQWQADLLEHERLRQMPTGSRSEEQARRKAMEDLESKIDRCHAELDAALNAGHPGPLAPPDEGGPLAQPPIEVAEGPQQPVVETVSPSEASVPDVAVQLELPAQEAASGEPTPTGISEAPPAETSPAEESEFVNAVLPTETEAGIETSLPEPIEELTFQPPQPPEAMAVTIAPQEEEIVSVSPVVPTDEADVTPHRLLWDMVAEDDLAGAYWLARSLSAMGRPTPVPDWLLAAVQGARWLTADTPGLARDLLQIANSHVVTDHNTSSWELLSLAAALNPALVAPYSGMVAWLDTPSICPELRDLVEAVRTFAGFGLGLHPEDALGAAGEQQRAEAIAAASREAQRWLAEASSRRKRVTSVWRGLVGPRGRLREFLLPVCENRQERVREVREELNRLWKDRGAVYRLFDEVNASTSIGRPERVTGAGKQDLYRQVARATDLVERWCALVERAREIKARGDWFRGQVVELRERVERALPNVEASLIELAASGSQDVVSSAQVLRRSLNQLRELLNLPTSGQQSLVAAFSLKSLATDPDSLEAMLVGRLLYLPEVTLDDAGKPTDEGLLAVAAALQGARQEQRTLHSAGLLWVKKQDYRFCDRILVAISDQDLADDLRRRYEEALGVSRATLRAAINEVRNQVEQALLDDVINDQQRAEYGARFESLVVEEVRNFGAKLADLEKVQQAIQQAYEQRLAHLQAQYREISGRLRASDMPLDRQQKALEFVSAALERRNVRVAEEALAHLRQVLDTGAVLSDDWYAPASARDYLEEFRAAVPDIESWLEQTRSDLRALADAARNGTTVAGIQFSRLGEPRRKEASKAFLAWHALKRSSGKGNNAALIATVLRYLGFDLKTGDAASISPENADDDWLHVRAQMSAAVDLVRPIPEFGSQAEGRYDVICLWERPGAESIAARLSSLKLDIHPVIVFYLGRITERQKRDLVRVSREKELAIAVLDETLLVFLAGERDTRLPAFLRCALPYSALNPYRPFQAGDVPPEMFFGRDEMARELMQPGGSCLVYGGRQLGKSALLRHVERQFHRPERDQYAWIENMKLVFDPSVGKDRENIWSHLRDEFKAHKLLGSRISTDKPRDIQQYIRDSLRSNPGRRVIVMLDEADAFLDADAKKGFGTVIALRELMLDTDRRFKVIFAGLQNVQRFQGIPDQPLAHFGRPICVGPLAPTEAQQLVRQPLEVLGYRFADNSVVLKILSYTNYHPGLIQYFCQELLKHLRKDAGTVLPPQIIRQEDIEAVYRKPEVRERIRERFEWTLALDMHYQAIAWALIEDQAEDLDGYGRAYSPSRILELVRDWWPAGFRDTSSDQLRGWLDELCGLGVLVRAERTGQYWLRSPNMVRLLGKETDIADRLLELSTKSPAVVMEADSHHALLDEKFSQYSPLTYAQERSLLQPRFGVGLIFASDASGWNVLPRAIRRFAGAENEDCTLVPSAVAGRELDDWLAEYLKAHARTERMILYQQVRPGVPGELADLVGRALRFCQRRQVRNRWLRILFLFDPESTWQWLALPTSERLRLEEEADTALWPRPWTASAVRHRLAQRDMMDKDEQGTSAALKATGGWHYLLDVLWVRCGQETDLRPKAREMEQELSDPRSQLAADFRSRLGIDRNEVARRVLRFVMTEGKDGLDEELLAPDLIEGGPRLSEVQCNQAKEYLLRLGLLRRESQVLRPDPVVAQVMTGEQDGRSAP